MSKVLPPAAAIATLKRNLGPGRRIEAFDQIHVTTTRTLDRITSGRYPVQVNVATDAEMAAELERQLGSYDTDTDVLTALTATATFRGRPALGGGLRALPRNADGFTVAWGGPVPGIFRAVGRAGPADRVQLG